MTQEERLCGINTVKISSAEGIGFAIPINTVKPIINSFINTGAFNEAYLGVSAYDKEAIPYVDSSVSFSTGVYVMQAAVDGPAGSAGIKVGDIIKKIDDTIVNKMSELRRYIYTKNPGDKVNLTVMRNGKERIFEVVLGKKG